MLWMAAAVAISGTQTIAGRDVQLALTREGGVVAERLFARDGAGKMRLVLGSPGLAARAAGPDSGAVQGARKGLYTGVPDLGFTEWATRREGEGRLVVLTAKSSLGTLEKRVFVPDRGRTIHVELIADFGVKRTQLHALLLSYAFLPDGRGELPDSTFLPGLRPLDDNVCGDHFFRAPAAVAQRGPLAAILAPDVEVLAENRPMETVLDLDAKNGVCDATLLTYGFCANRLSGHVRFSTDSSLLRNVPGRLRLAADLILDAQAEPYAAYEQAADYAWAKYGHRYFERVKPQMAPFADYARLCYPAAISGGHGVPAEPGWFETTIDGMVCGGIPSGWGYQQGWVSWQCWFNQLRSAWGLHWWGARLKRADWTEKSNKMLNLALAAPMDRGACPTTYQFREKRWKGTLIAPDPRCYYDLTNMAWKGIWLLRWLDFKDCPRREEIVAQCLAMAQRMIDSQNADGSFPTWLDKDLKVVPILDPSAQSALPAWFLAELAGRAEIKDRALGGAPWLAGETQAGPAAVVALDRARRAADFLVKNVVDQQRYYDFETFFSCSPKECLQRDGKIDDVAMHDPHSLCPPQNTLCMQWTAEALMAVSRRSSTPEEGGYRRAALKALEMMALYQNAWDISYRIVAYDFGGFGVQNSDGEYNDARQAQFGCTLADFGAELGRQDLFERGVAATRASLTLINSPLHAKYDIYPNPNYPLGLEPENDGHGGSDQQNGRSGFDWGEGSGLASMAWLLDKYGSGYVHDDPTNGWEVGIDGINLSPLGDASSLMPETLRDMEVEIVDSEGRRQKQVAPPHPRVETFGFGIRDGRIGVAFTLAGDGADAFKGELVRDDGRRLEVEARPLAEQSGLIRRGGYFAETPPDWSGHRIWVKGKPGPWYLNDGPYIAWIDPSWDFENLDGWTVQGNFAELPTWSTRMNFGLRPGEGFIGTCEDGAGGFDDRFTGTLTSPSFVVSKPTIRLLVGGGSLPGVSVELLDPSGKPIYTERGHDRERMDERTWDVSRYIGKTLQIRITDKETGGWGHINVGRIRSGEGFAPK